MATGSASSTELEILRTLVTSAESVAFAISQQRDTNRERLSKYSVRASHMFGSMHESDCPMERARLCPLGVRNMYGGSLLRVGDNPPPAQKFLDATFGLFGQARS